MEEFARRIILLFGIGNNLIQGFSVVYEGEDGSAGSLNVWYDEDLFNKVRFISEGESCIVYEKKTRPKLFGGQDTKITIQKILIRRDFQSHQK